MDDVPPWNIRSLSRSPLELPPHHLLAGGIYGFFGKKKHQVYFPATTEQSIARVNLFRKPSNSLILMAIDALIAICLIHLLW
jgi:hypothetical protein